VFRPTGCGQQFAGVLDHRPALGIVFLECLEARRRLELGRHVVFFELRFVGGGTPRRWQRLRQRLGLIARLLLLPRGRGLQRVRRALRRGLLRVRCSLLRRRVLRR
jgi:hypothetical protein